MPSPVPCTGEYHGVGRPGIDTLLLRMVRYSELAFVIAKVIRMRSSSRPPSGHDSIRRLSLGLATAVSALLTVSGATAAGAAVAPPSGAARPPAGSGIGTTAALQNPRCSHDDPQFGVYGRFNSMIAGGGTVCVKPWHAGDDNGGSTAPGVTKSTITVVGVVPNDAELAGVSRAAGTAAVNRASDATGTYKDAVHDYLLAAMRYYETWGRDIEMKFVTSSGTDESAQRADVVAITAEKPFAVVNFVGVGLDILEGELAKSKILVWGSATTSQKALAAAPYRWGLSDAQAGAVNSAEVIGKQLVAKKAKFAGGDDLKTQTRKFGVVYIPTLIDIAQFKQALAKYHGAVASENSYTSNGATFGDASLAQDQAPVIVTKMKNAGVTTVVLFSDVAMNKAMMDQATKQDWFPEWFITGSVFQDIAIFARGYDQQQFAHTFGVSNLPPYTQTDPTPAPPAKSLTVLINPLNWYWGEHVGTEVPSNMTTRIPWLLNGIQAAGPILTPRTFQQGLFAIPAAGGAASGYTTGARRRLRAQPWPALRRVPATRPRLRAGVVGRADHRTVERHRHRGQGRRALRQRRQALPRRHLAHEADSLVRKDRERRRLRHPPTPDT